MSCHLEEGMSKLQTALPRLGTDLGHMVGILLVLALLAAAAVDRHHHLRRTSVDQGSAIWLTERACSLTDLGTRGFRAVGATSGMPNQGQLESVLLQQSWPAHCMLSISLMLQKSVPVVSRYLCCLASRDVEANNHQTFSLPTTADNAAALRRRLEPLALGKTNPEAPSLPKACSVHAKKLFCSHVEVRTLFKVGLGASEQHPRATGPVWFFDLRLELLDFCRGLLGPAVMHDKDVIRPRKLREQLCRCCPDMWACGG